MGKPQGDHLPQATIYVREVNGELVERPAYTPADHVNLKAHGWVTTEEHQNRQASGQTAARHGGSQRREAARVVPQRAAEAPADGPSSV